MSDNIDCNSMTVIMMNGNEFLKKLRKLGKKDKIKVLTNNSRGKGSHITVYFGNNRTTLKDRTKEIGQGLLASMLKDLKINPSDL